MFYSLSYFVLYKSLYSPRETKLTIVIFLIHTIVFLLNIVYKWTFKKRQVNAKNIIQKLKIEQKLKEK